MSIDYRPRVIADVMPSHFGKTVILLGRVGSIDPSGKKINVKDCANSNVIAFLKQPLTSILEVDSWVELEGKVKGKGAMDVERFEQLPSSLFENFDVDLYVEAIKILHSPATSNNYVIDDKIEHHGSEDNVELITNAADSGKNDMDGLQEESFLNL